MSLVLNTAVAVALLGSALIGGVFFAFSSFIMKALARMPSPEGIAAMQSINVVVLNRSFLGTFTGTAVISLLVAVMAIIDRGAPSAPWFLAGAIAYVVGTFLLTGLGNVPLNNRLAGLDPSEPDSARIWQRYLERWTLLNTLRTVAALLAAVLLVCGLLSA